MQKKCDLCGGEMDHVAYLRLINELIILICSLCEDYIREGENNEFRSKTIQRLDQRCASDVRPEGQQQQLLFGGCGRTTDAHSGSGNAFRQVSVAD
jgi:hypothetical protein